MYNNTNNNVESVKAQVIEARLVKGLSYSTIKKQFGVPKSTAQGWINKHVALSEVEIHNPQSNYVQAYAADNLQREKQPKNKKTEEEIFSFLEQLAPITVPKNDEYVNTKYTHNNYAVVGSDFHFGCHDEKAIDIFLATIDTLCPKVIVLNGDTMDMLAISRYPKDIRKNWSLLDERKAYHSFLASLTEVSRGATIYETVSNHSGQSIDGRWRRYLSERLGELSSLPEISDLLSYQNVFMGEYKDRVEHVDFVDLNGLIVTHGTTVRKNGGYSARGEIEKWGASILHGHTHRIGSTCQRIPAIANRPERQIYGFEGGCLCSLDASYGTAFNWQQGFNIVSLGDDEFSFGVEPVMINNGIANIATLGYTIKA